MPWYDSDYPGSIGRFGPWDAQYSSNDSSPWDHDDPENHPWDANWPYGDGQYYRIGEVYDPVGLSDERGPRGRYLADSPGEEDNGTESGPWDANYPYEDGRYFQRGTGDVYDPIGFGDNRGAHDDFELFEGESVGYRGRLDSRYPFSEDPPPQGFVDRRYRELRPALSAHGEWPAGPPGYDYAGQASEAAEMEQERRYGGEGSMFGLPPVRRGEKSSARQRPPLPSWEDDWGPNSEYERQRASRSSRQRPPLPSWEDDWGPNSEYERRRAGTW
ncbi:hypothetical protein LTR91_019199 [Friedmanniomyces endolithicus]|uniref:Uncharacterized protein n=1 Tax=Friedmanniomyces endolithicus TaxID=329885 RepID=A0AAN6HBE4_9PEZI|nr:hypothetical protein LTS00_014959 [Friedmanniomyces endolithicus]KAK0281568.1 hypothetical protein LTR35_007247 [Friedmanniomyces endolithicus]KAK0308641.1 hypothetical protein LTR82_015453 [Friedmanniomyces endolithicus]KAK0315421.1 hypothetical protein LTR01_000719 [Friedmanniomyces endolithicus]KAK0827084.1 hypothetical protein LTR73_005867 [Friedmanniomyces endolithicus]